MSDAPFPHPASRPQSPFGPPPNADRDPLLADLTEPQREAVLHTEGPLLILAAAGSGKTRVITRRIAHLVRIGVPPWQILALTFTNKAAGEMRARVMELLGAGEEDRPPRGLTVTTFHSLCARLLRRYAEMAKLPGLKHDFTIYDSADQRSLMKRVIVEAGLNTSNWPPRSALSAISNAKNELKDAARFQAEAGDFYARNIAKLYEGYEKALRRAGAVDFDDLLMLTVRMLQTCDEARQEIQHRWRYLMIDEYQDTNHAQFVLASLLVGDGESALRADSSEESGENGSEIRSTGPNVCVVGDPDQAIYGWRGADIRNIMEFEEQYPGAAVISLGQNFRSTAPILAAADHLIRNNKMRKHKDLFTTSEGGENPEAILCRNEHHEADVVIDWLRARREESDGALQWKDMAVFYRTNALSRVMEDAMRDAGIPYVIARGTAFYDREEVRDALAYLRIVANPADDVSLSRIVNKPARGLGATTLAKIEMAAQRDGVAMLDALRSAASMHDLTARARSAAAKFIETLNGWTGDGAFMGAELSGSLRDLVERVVRESGLEKHYSARSKKGAGDEAADEDRVANLEELISSAAEFEQRYQADADPANDIPDDEAPESDDTPPLLAMLRAYLESVALVSDADKVDPEQGAVTLMTLHAAKGLEFGAVAMIGLEDGLLPHSRARESEAELEEERRLCFVGVTRAMRRLLMTCAAMRTHRGMRERAIPSQFLSELPQDGVVFSDQSAPEHEDGWDDPHDPVARLSEPGRSGAPVHRAPALQRAEMPYPPGAAVRHPQFGEGTVLSVMSAGANARAQIRFRHVGVKTLVLEYARLERIG
ncbi:MAG: hypothetical protein EA376_13205 [Phycisphaeraceae bacterium]|nr:MAG: hypothetical protein EA376_13205 [Phycisphaeraceae bacterium]